MSISNKMNSFKMFIHHKFFDLCHSFIVLYCLISDTVKNTFPKFFYILFNLFLDLADLHADGEFKVLLLKDLAPLLGSLVSISL